MKRKVLSLLLATTMVVAMVGCGNNNSSSTDTNNSSAAVESTDSNNAQSDATDSNEIAKPDSIRVVVNGTVVTQENGQGAFEAQLEELLGLDIKFDQQDHSGYSDAVGRIFASGDWPDVILLSAEQYSAYATAGVLWDMTEM